MMFDIINEYGEQDTVYAVRKNESGETEFMYWRKYDGWVWYNAKRTRPVEQDGGAE